MVWKWWFHDGRYCFVGAKIIYAGCGRSLTLFAICMSAPMWHRSQISGLFSRWTSAIFRSNATWLSAMPFNWLRDRSSACQTWMITSNERNQYKCYGHVGKAQEEWKNSRHSWCRHTSRPLTGWIICIDTLTKWFPDKFNALIWPSGTSSSYGISPISAIDNVFRRWSNYRTKRKAKTIILFSFTIFVCFGHEISRTPPSVLPPGNKKEKKKRAKRSWKNLVRILLTWNDSRMSYKSICMLPLMFSECNFFSGSTVADSNFTNLL